jgi:hypothetical protein
MEDHAEPRAERVLGFQSCTSSFTSLFRLLCLFFYCYLSHVALNPVSSHALNVVHTLIINSLHMASGCLVSCLVSFKAFPTNLGGVAYITNGNRPSGDDT